MNKVYIDTALFAVPNYAIDSETGQEIIDRVIHFSELASPGFPLKMIIADDVEAMLWGSNMGPDYDQIDQFLEIMELKQIYSANDLLQRYHLLFQQCDRASELNEVEVCHLQDFVADPVLPDVSPALLINETCRVFATAAALTSLQQRLHVGSAFFGSQGTDYSIRTTVLAVGGTDTTKLSQPPVEVQAVVSTFTHLRDLISSPAADELWSVARTPYDLHFAITVGALALQKEAGEDIDAAGLTMFAIGSEFFRSLEEVECLGNGRYAGATRELCSQIVAGKCNRQVNPFSLKRQYVRQHDNATAWRTHLTNSGLGLRLMYWQNVNGIEFATVDVKSGERIDVGVVSETVGMDLREYFN
ncbi:hypothetical protein ACFVTJ_15095 [Agrobacterium sp. NPDC058088]|uniref:hypothetical protein n=1 Tax=Agrobacterium sp. NPDC058088 TaxID=3346335 RepID=UPI0036D8A38F